MNWKEALGLIGGAVTTFSFVPQIWRLYRLKSAREVSLAFTILFAGGVTCWMVYGLLLGLFPVILWNALSLVLALMILVAKIKFGAKGKDPQG